jgi:anti-sigma factor ChrR (cupin superfamily)
MSRPKNSAPPTIEQQELAAMAALDLASPTEVATAPKHLVNELREATWMLSASIAPVAPAASLRDRLMTRVAQFEQLKPAADVRRNEEHWVNSGVPGVDIKQLFHEKETGRSTYLLRMEAGRHLPAHYHPDAEQCLVLKGDIAWGDIVYEEGDFVVMGKGTHHPEIHTVNGNLLLLISGHNEFDHV